MTTNQHQWQERYQPTNNSLWQGRHDGPQAPRFHEIIAVHDLRNELSRNTLQGKQYGLIGFASDEGIRRNQGRTGAFEGPSSFRTAFAKLPANLPKNTQIFDFGDITCMDRNLEEAQNALATIITFLIKNNIHPVIVGGGHEVAWASYQGITNAHPNMTCGIINLDAHYDLRPLSNESKGSSGTSFSQIAQQTKELGRPFDYTCIGIQKLNNTQHLHNTANTLGVTTIFAESLFQENTTRALQAIESSAQRNQILYLTICLDVFAAPYAPGVSAPQPLGITPWHAIPLIRKTASLNKCIAIDIAELSPQYDTNGTTAQLAALLISEYIHSNAKIK